MVLDDEYHGMQLRELDGAASDARNVAKTVVFCYGVAGGDSPVVVVCRARLQVLAWVEERRDCILQK